LNPEDCETDVQRWKRTICMLMKSRILPYDTVLYSLGVEVCAIRGDGNGDIQRIRYESNRSDPAPNLVDAEHRVDHGEPNRCGSTKEDSMTKKAQSGKGTSRDESVAIIGVL